MNFVFFSKSELHLIREKNITENVIAALNELTKTRKIEIKKGMAWCDNPKSKYYNKLIFTKRSKEMLMRKDHLYDIVVFVKYNSTRVKKNKGSAIFIHVARKNYSPTKGCVALNVKNLKNNENGKIIKNEKLKNGKNVKIEMRSFGTLK